MRKLKRIISELLYFLKRLSSDYEERYDEKFNVRQMNRCDMYTKI